MKPLFALLFVPKSEDEREGEAALCGGVADLFYRPQTKRMAATAMAATTATTTAMPPARSVFEPTCFHRWQRVLVPQEEELEEEGTSKMGQAALRRHRRRHRRRWPMSSGKGALLARATLGGHACPLPPLFHAFGPQGSRSRAHTVPVLVSRSESDKKSV